ncbi:hypothetical protein Rsub_03155 [Raphidocelis subcapitata]|uniref:CobW/HypB/UreG nucleotide-binding domain-containing protein n=1 Tax=Raphidocelis subcapitata TaxID=307507 RepID=A0A2V0NYD8_9CHLO|nr:hypothetical protein Rsub_03155 [Raphidocelis subcapitata]|eukprot:GBF90583.1 hypothetical protein Rsub_03155 [Raphidocelis subcapitata]
MAPSAVASGGGGEGRSGGTSAAAPAAAAAPRTLKLPIPVNIVTGALGAGKTTALRHLIDGKPPGEVWAVLVNDFGACGVDGAALGGGGGGGGVTIRQIAGGCMCCVTSGLLTPAIAQLVRQVKPDRLLIEPSGLGHPGGLIDVLRGPHLGSALELRAVICLVDLSRFDPEALQGMGVAADQIAIADVLVGSKADLLRCDAAAHVEPEAAAAEAAGEDAEVGASAAAAAEASHLLPASGSETDGRGGGGSGGSGQSGSGGSGSGTGSGSRAADFHRWARGLYPPKAEVRIMSGGELDPALLDLPRSSAFASLTAAWRAPRGGRRRGLTAAAPAAAAAAAAAAVEEEAAGGEEGPAAAGAPQEPRPAPRAPARIVRPGGGAAADAPPACGWAFHSEDRFDRAPLLALLQRLRPRVARVKGVFRVGAAEWALPAARLGGGGREELALAPVCYRGESVAEVILHSGGGGGGVTGGGRSEGPPSSGHDDAQGARAEEAVAAAAAGDWGPLEALLVATLTGAGR